MSANRNRRLVKEIQDIQKDTNSGVSLEPFTKAKDGSDSFDDLTHFKGVFNGPPDTPYEGGTFVVDIKIPNEYPFQPPIMKFQTKIWHPNVSSVTGYICLDTLSTAWSPILTLKSALISLQSLLSSPEPKDPQDAEVARMLLTAPEQFAKVAQEWAIKYAGAPEKSNATNRATSAQPTEQESEESKKTREEAARIAQYRGYNSSMVDRFTDLGFDVATVVAAFQYVGIEHGEEYDLDDDTADEITSRLLNET